ncbi:MAG: hypothetical protein PUA72_14515, partial [Lachnospiraceae bacterium]|nr:hypothetical protein [Lachnospiraceae bacterium]
IIHRKKRFPVHIGKILQKNRSFCKRRLKMQQNASENRHRKIESKVDKAHYMDYLLSRTLLRSK